MFDLVATGILVVFKKEAVSGHKNTLGDQRCEIVMAGIFNTCFGVWPKHGYFGFL
jgi:hypothetical protein